MREIINKTDYGNKKSFIIPDTVQRITVNKTTGELPGSDDDPSVIEEGLFSVFDTKS
jgi:hypothetical protein